MRRLPVAKGQTLATRPSCTSYDVLAGLLQCEQLSRRLYELFWPEGGRAAVW